MRALLVHLIALAFGALTISGDPVCAQEASGSSKPWPADPSSVSAACGQDVHDLFNPWVTASQPRDWSGKAPLAINAAAQMTACTEAYSHPKYALMRAFFEEAAAMAYFVQSDHVDGNRYLHLAQSDLRYVSTYTNLPPEYSSSAGKILEFESKLTSQAEGRSASLDGNPSPGPSAQEASGGLPWPPDPPNVSGACQMTTTLTSLIRRALRSEQVVGRMRYRLQQGPQPR